MFAPPQSTSVSTPFCRMSVHVPAGMHGGGQMMGPPSFSMPASPSIGMPPSLKRSVRIKTNGDR
jgi:hypothetical protein